MGAGKIASRGADVIVDSGWQPRVIAFAPDMFPNTHDHVPAPITPDDLTSGYRVFIQPRSGAQLASAIALTKHGDAEEVLQLGREALPTRCPSAINGARLGWFTSAYGR
jgi:hypothetical protein